MKLIRPKLLDRDAAARARLLPPAGSFRQVMHTLLAKPPALAISMEEMNWIRGHIKRFRHVWELPISSNPAAERLERHTQPRSIL